MVKRILTALVAIGIIACPRVLAQGHDPYSKALDLYNSGMYSEAGAIFGTLEGASAQGYAALCALRLDSVGCMELSEEFLNRWPESVLVPQVRFYRALNRFEQERFEDAVYEFRLVGQNELAPSQAAEYAFKKGYSAFATGDYESASALLHSAASMPYSAFTAPTWYTIGYMEYTRKNFSKASEWFQKAATDPRFDQLAAYYILECRFMEKDYQYVVEKGEELFENIPQDRRPHMARLMSEAYLILGDSEKARAYYQKILEGDAPKTRGDYFYAGSLMYSLEDWQGAVDNYSRMTERTDSLGQVANYQLGYSFIQLRNKVAALEAFREASEADFDPYIKEDAYFNYAKLAFDINHDTSAFNDYLDTYGGLDKGDRIYSYMAMAALANHDYEGAVNAYDRIDHLDPGMRSNYMKAYFLRACQLMESGSWRTAVSHLKAAAYYSDKSNPFNQLARYWLAEAYYRDGKYKEARNILTELYNLSALDGKQEGNLIPYHLAYTWFMEGEYDKALRWFNNYIESDDLQCKADAMVRVGDCYFFSKDYNIAITSYELKIGTYPDDNDLYPSFRAGMAAGLLDDQYQKIRFLVKATTSSNTLPYWPESMYELGKAYTTVGDMENAMRIFRSLSAGAIDPDYTSRALLEMGTISRSMGEMEEALSYYKTVVEQGGHYVDDALLAIESIYKITGEPEAYLEYMASVQDLVEQSEERREAVYFSAIEQIYLASNWTRAISTLTQYMEKFPEGAHMPQALFYLAESYRNMEQYEKALDYYSDAIDAGLDGAFLEQAWRYMSTVCLRLEKYDQAYDGFNTLLSIARLEENKLEARQGKMRAAYRGRQWAKAADAALDVLDQELTEPQTREATYVLAKSYIGTNNRDKALELLNELALKPSTAEGAEATYLIIQDLYDRGNFAQVQEKVYEFSPLAVGQMYWLAKAYIVLGDSFMELGNEAQARATFESLLTGYTPYGPGDDVLDQVNMRLSRM